jgi:hypothetical protein
MAEYKAVMLQCMSRARDGGSKKEKPGEGGGSIGLVQPTQGRSGHESPG